MYFRCYSYHIYLTMKSEAWRFKLSYARKNTPHSNGLHSSQTLSGALIQEPPVVGTDCSILGNAHTPNLLVKYINFSTSSTLFPNLPQIFSSDISWRQVSVGSSRYSEVPGGHSSQVPGSAGVEGFEPGASRGRCPVVATPGRNSLGCAQSSPGRLTGSGRVRRGW